MLNKDPDRVTDEAPLIILDINSAVFKAKNYKDTKHTSYISIRVHFVNNGEKCKMHNIEWCEGGTQLADIATKNFGENFLNHIMKYITVRLKN